MDGPWPFEKKKEEMSWIEEEYNCKVTEEEKKEVIKQHAEFIESRKWEDMTDQQLIDQLVQWFPDIFSEK